MIVTMLFLFKSLSQTKMRTEIATTISRGGKKKNSIYHMSLVWNFKEEYYNFNFGSIRGIKILRTRAATDRMGFLVN